MDANATQALVTNTTQGPQAIGVLPDFNTTFITETAAFGTTASYVMSSHTFISLSLPAPPFDSIVVSLMAIFGALDLNGNGSLSKVIDKIS